MDSPVDVLRFVEFVVACAEPHRGRLGGLVDRAIRRSYRRCDSTPTAHPLISLPEIPGITFLDTVDAVITEGARMNNCLAQLAGVARAGDDYFFHVEHRGEMASVQIHATGEVEAAAGPGNTTNGAAIWGARRLALWGRSLGADCT